MVASSAPWVWPFMRDRFDMSKCGGGADDPFQNWALKPGFNVSVAEVDAAMLERWTYANKRYWEIVASLDQPY